MRHPHHHVRFGRLARAQNAFDQNLTFVYALLADERRAQQISQCAIFRTVSAMRCLIRREQGDNFRVFARLQITICQQQRDFRIFALLCH